MVDYKGLINTLLDTPKGQKFKDDPRFKLNRDEKDSELKNKYIMLQNVIRQGLNPMSSRLKETINEVLKNKLSENKPCWKGYKFIGMKDGEDGKKVPNCVPKNKK